ncbi:MAG TPA: succinate dehydrogenase [Casimicrobiaceae bacterium]|nr:succinate dehydrogenase [Casimicrobiaceae bacterium]
MMRTDRPARRSAHWRVDAWLWLLQRASAAVLAVCVAVHLATIFYAVHAGLTAQTILGRMHASIAWPAFYVLFVVAAAVHAPIGLRAVASEWLGFGGRRADLVAAAIGIALLALGLRAVWALAR